MSDLTRKSSNSHTLDLLRGLAALAVVIFHFDGLTRRLGIDIPYAVAGEVGVQLFFVLSGFFIGKSVLSPREFSARDYTLNRVYRIIPNYYFSLIIVLCLVNVSFLFAKGGLGNLITHLTFLHGFFREWRVSINGVYWTLSIEWLFYVFMLLFARPIRNPRTGWWVAIGMIVVAIAYKVWMWRNFSASPGMLNLYYKQLPGMLDQFGCGLIVALLLKGKSVKEWASGIGVKYIGLTFSIVAVVAATVIYVHLPPVPQYWGNAWMVIGWPLGFCIAAAGLVFFLQQFEPEIGPWLDRSRLSFIGVISYSLYIYHALVINAFASGWKKVSATCPAWLYLTSAALAIFLVSTLMYFLIEKPFMDMRARAKNKTA